MKIKKTITKAVLMAVVFSSVLFAMACSKSGSSSFDPTKVTGNFDWKRYSGQEVTVFMVEHQTSSAMVAKLKEFTDLTGIKVKHQITPEANYFDQVNSALASRSGTPDLFMTGAYQAWGYSAAGNIEPLQNYIASPALTNSDYDVDDFVPSAFNSLKWDGVAGHAVGTGDQLAIPLGDEVYLLAYNKRAFAKAGITKVPETYDELLAACDKLKQWGGSDTYAIGLRGARDWGTIHPGYMSTYKNFGATDFAVENGKLVSKVNSPESVRMNEFFVDLVRRGGSTQWSSTYWYMALAEFGAGKSAMLFDASNCVCQVDLQGMAEAGNIGYAVMPLARPGNPINSNLWIWSMAMNSSSKHKGAAWLFLQYFSGKDFLIYSSTVMNNMDPVRKSVWENADFKAKIAPLPGFYEAWEKTNQNATIQFTPYDKFFEATTEWAGTLQDLVAGGKYTSVQAGLDALKANMDRMVQE